MRRLCGALLVALFLTTVLRSTIAQEQSTKPKKQQKTGERCLKYLNEVKDHLTNSYIEGDRIKPSDLVQAAARGMTEAVSDPAFESLAQETKDAIRKNLSEGSFESLEDIFAALKEIGETYGTKGINMMKLADLAAAAMLEQVGDPFSHIFTSEELMKLVRIMLGQDREKSLGLSVAPEDGKLTVAYVMYGYPAYVAGLEIGDQILEIDGKSTEGMDFKAATEILQGKAGGEVKFTIRREGLLKPYTFVVSPLKDMPKDVIHAMLPGDIGYLRMTIFDLMLAGSVRSALKSLDKEGMRGLILDLRNNPGGALPAATAVADEFIGDNKLITYTETKYEPKMPAQMKFLQDMIGNQPSEFRATKKSKFEKMPVILLVNKASASASELLSGAFQDTGRALLIGETTYGKGVGQTAIPLWESGGGKELFGMPSRFLYLTVMRYYLPTGRSINHIGVKPDLEVVMPKLTGEKFDAVWQLHHSGRLEEYLSAHFDKDSGLFRELAKYDGFDCSKYPKFGAFYKGLKTSLSEDEVREELRQAVRRRIEQESGKRFPYDCQADLQLQAALLEMQDTLGK